LALVSDGGTGWHGPVSETVLQIIRDDHALGLLGHDAAAHRRLRHRWVTGRHRGGPHARAAASAVELACWDLVSKVCGRSVPELLGGIVRKSIPAYASALGLDPAHPDAPEAARWITESGFWGQKWPLTKQLILAGPSAVAEVLSRLREAAGEGRLMVDGLRRCSLDQAMRLLPVLAELRVEWAEELLPPGSPAWRRLRSSARDVPLAAGEHAVNEAEQARTLTGGEVDIWQPDPGWGGGLARSLHTVEVAADQGIRSFPHGAHLPAALALAASCCRDTVPAVEYHLTVEPLRQQLFSEPIRVRDGQLGVRTAPGIARPMVLADSTPVWQVGL
jgi:L-alanine-DL-glutamate epimerase-like enolase superfamily enzyme